MHGQDYRALVRQYTSCTGIWASDVIGVILWVVGFVMECSADFQKYGFKQNPSNKGRFVNVGEHPILEYEGRNLL